MKRLIFFFWILPSVVYAQMDDNLLLMSDCPSCESSSLLKTIKLCSKKKVLIDECKELDRRIEFTVKEKSYRHVSDGTKKLIKEYQNSKPSSLKKRKKLYLNPIFPTMKLECNTMIGLGNGTISCDNGKTYTLIERSSINDMPRSDAPKAYLKYSEQYKKENNKVIEN